MVLTIKKAEIEDLDRMVLTIMSMKNSDECITQDEMHDYIDRTYYTETEEGNILAIICANRRSIPYSDEATSLGLYSTRYQIKYLLFCKQAIEDCGYDVVRVITRLIKELCADLNDWSVWVDAGFQASINLGSEKDETIEVITKAALANSFKQAVNRFALIRVTPIDHLSLH